MGNSPQSPAMAPVAAKTPTRHPTCNCCREVIHLAFYNERDLGLVCPDCHFNLTRSASFLACEGIAGCDKGKEK